MGDILCASWKQSVDGVWDKWFGETRVRILIARIQQSFTVFRGEAMKDQIRMLCILGGWFKKMRPIIGFVRHAMLCIPGFQLVREPTMVN